METGNAIKLDVAKDFTVPVARLYQAWIAPEELKQWWHPMRNVLQRAITQPQVGSPVEYVFANEKVEPSFTINGTYKDVQEGTCLVYTWNWQIPAATIGNSEYLLTVVFSSSGNGSRLSVTQENFTDEEALHPHREGWQSALNDLYHFLSQH